MLGLSPNVAIWTVAGLATLGVIARPFSWPEAIWGVLGAACLLAFGLMPTDAAWHGVIEERTSTYS